MESKCPMCGERLCEYVSWPGAQESLYFACSQEVDCMFSCNASDLHRIAAAMELARASIKYEDANKETEISDWDALCDARKHAYEVFGGTRWTL